MWGKGILIDVCVRMIWWFPPCDGSYCIVAHNLKRIRQLANSFHFEYVATEILFQIPIQNPIHCLNVVRGRGYAFWVWFSLEMTERKMLINWVPIAKSIPKMGFRSNNFSATVRVAWRWTISSFLFSRFFIQLTICGYILTCVVVVVSFFLLLLICFDFAVKPKICE